MGHVLFTTAETIITLRRINSKMEFLSGGLNDEKYSKA